MWPGGWGQQGALSGHLVWGPTELREWERVPETGEGLSLQSLLAAEGGGPWPPQKRHEIRAEALPQAGRWSWVGEEGEEVTGVEMAGSCLRGAGQARDDPGQVRAGFLHPAPLTHGPPSFRREPPWHCRVLSSIHSTPAAPSFCDNQKCLQTVPNVPGEGEEPLHLRVTEIDAKYSGNWHSDRMSSCTSIQDCCRVCGGPAGPPQEVPGRQTPHTPLP